MNETNTAIVAAPKLTTVDQVVAQLQTYDTGAEKSLGQLEAKITEYTNQVTEWKRIQVAILGQRQLIKDLLNKTVEAPAETSIAPK